MEQTDFKTLYAELKEKFNLALIEYLRPYEKSVSENLYDAVRYSVVNSGKRLRPMLCMLGARFAGRQADDVMDFAMAVEMIHAYSLVHDDLPAVDNDSLRRGRLTTHVMHGDAMAVFAGDALLTLACEIMTAGVVKTSDFSRLKAMELVLRCSGIKGLLNGQARDIDYDNCQSYFLEHIVNMYRNKTSDLFRASLVSGALIAGAKRDELESLSVFCDAFGIYFQIKDDLEDEEEPKIDMNMSVDDYLAAESGETETKDEPAKNPDDMDEIEQADFFKAQTKEKTTFVKAAGRDEAIKAMAEYEGYAREALEPYGDKASELVAFFEYVKGL